MVSSFICGANKLPRDEDDYERHTRSADSSPRRPRSKNKNPYSTRGLDKFSSLLAKIEEKRRLIYSQVDPNEISFVRFEYSGDHDFKPIVVKSNKHNNKDNLDHHSSINEIKSFVSDQNPSKILKKLESSKPMNSEINNNKVGDDNEVMISNHKKINKNMGCGRRLMRVHRWKESTLVLPMIFVLILVFLVLFGRSFAIMCTSIGWYVIPTITNKKNANASTSSKTTSFKRRKDYAIRRLSDKRIMTSECTKSFKN